VRGGGSGKEGGKLFEVKCLYSYWLRGVRNKTLGGWVLGASMVPRKSAA
jgi:hypothetical protein